MLTPTAVWAGMPRSVVLLDSLMIIFLAGGMRFAARLLWEGPGSVWSRPSGGKRALIVGAGEAGEQLLRQMQHEPRVRMDVVGLIDDDPTTHGRHIHGVRILGGIERLPEFVRRHRVALVAIAIPSATGEQMRRIVDRCRESGADFKVLPPIRELLNGPDVPSEAERTAMWEAEERRRYDVATSRATARLVLVSAPAAGGSTSRFVPAD